MPLRTCLRAFAGLVFCVAGFAVLGFTPHQGAPAGMPQVYQKWINTEVVYIATPQERSAFEKLTTDAERDAFMAQFWQRRNSNPASSYNFYRTEHDRRISFANANYTDGDTPGWKTDRGHIYILWGRPDHVVDSGPPRKTKAGNPPPPFEDWVYKCLPGIGDNVVVKFVDTCHCGDFTLDNDNQKKAALFAVPPANGQRPGCAATSEP